MSSNLNYFNKIFGKFEWMAGNAIAVYANMKNIFRVHTFQSPMNIIFFSFSWWKHKQRNSRIACDCQRAPDDTENQRNVVAFIFRLFCILLQKKSWRKKALILLFCFSFNTLSGRLVARLDCMNILLHRHCSNNLKSLPFVRLLWAVVFKHVQGSTKQYRIIHSFTNI